MRHGRPQRNLQRIRRQIGQQIRSPVKFTANWQQILLSQQFDTKFAELKSHSLRKCIPTVFRRDQWVSWLAC